MTTMRLFVVAVFIVTASVVTCAQSRGSMRPADIVRFANPADAQISPNGQFVVYTVSLIVEDKTVSTLWITRVAPQTAPIQPTAQPTPRC